MRVMKTLWCSRLHTPVKVTKVHIFKCHQFYLKKRTLSPPMKIHEVVIQLVTRFYPFFFKEHKGGFGTASLLPQADPELFLDPLIQPSRYWSSSHEPPHPAGARCFFNPPFPSRSHPHGLHMAWTRASPSFLESSNCFLRCLSPHFLKSSEVSVEASAPALRTPMTTLPTALFSKPLTREAVPNYFSSFSIGFSRYT